MCHAMLTLNAVMHASEKLGKTNCATIIMCQASSWTGLQVFIVMMSVHNIFAHSSIVMICLSIYVGVQRGTMVGCNPKTAEKDIACIR